MIERLERSVIQIKQFSNDVSHELRTPLAVILGEIELVSKKHRSIAEYKEALRSMYDETKKLESIINNLLLLSQMDFQKNLFTFTRMPLYEILMDCIKRIEAMAKQKKISLQIDKIEPVFITGEQSLLQSLIINLADNAVKYSHRGKTVAISLEKKHDKAILTFKDEGIGIPKESLPFIFNRFFRVDQSRTSGAKGFGLGLAIVHRIANLHHAEIKVDSQSGRGTVICVIFPLYSTN
jgi:signal transduction histidine kinase